MRLLHFEIPRQGPRRNWLTPPPVLDPKNGSAIFPVGNAELDEVAPTFRELLEGSGVSFVQGCVADVDLADKEVSVVGALSDNLEGFMVSDNADESEAAGAISRLPYTRIQSFFFSCWFHAYCALFYFCFFYF